MGRNELARHFILRNTFASALAVVDAVIKTPRQRILAHRTARVVGDVINVRRKKTLVGLVYAGGDVGPPEKGLDKRRAIANADFQLHQCPAWMETNAVHAFQAIQRIVVAAPDGL